MDRTRRTGVGQAGSSAAQRGPLLLPKGVWDSACHSRANKQARLVERSLFYFRCQQLVAEGGHLSKGQLPTQLPHYHHPGNQ